MELCDLNLEAYIYGKTRVDGNGGKASKELPPPLDAKSIWQVMTDVCDGLMFIHGNNEVHRDLKPSNSKPHLVNNLNSSFISCSRSCLENWRFRIFYGKVIKYLVHRSPERDAELPRPGTAQGGYLR